MQPAPRHDSHDFDEDLVWVKLAQSGDMDAFDEIVSKYQSTMTALLYRFAPDRADLEDMMQESFVRAWRALAGWQPDKPFIHWLKRIGVRVGLDFCRKRERTPFARLIESDGAGRDPLDSIAAGESPDESASHVADEAKFILSHLPPDDRALLTLLHLNELPLAEIAEHFGWSRAKAKIKAFRARQRLRTILARHEYTLE